MTSLLLEGTVDVIQTQIHITNLILSFEHNDIIIIRRYS